MKKTTIYIVMAVLCLNFTVYGQSNKAIDITATGIQIGQSVPDITITSIHNYKTTTAKISDFKGKLLILDFWATWCSPCVAMIPRMDSLQRAFGDKIQFLSVTYQDEKQVLPFLEKFEAQQKKHYSLPIVTNSKELHKLFPHVSLPHYVWIGADGVVKAITEGNYVTANNIKSLLGGKENNLRTKVDVAVRYDSSRPLFFDSTAFNSSFIKQSAFTNYQNGLGSGFNQNIYGPNDSEIKWFTMRNLTIPSMFQAIYKKEQKETIIECADTSKLIYNTPVGEDYREWLRNGNGFCYELIIKKGDESKALEYMKSDLNSYFSNYKIELQQRKVKCLALVRTSKVDKIHTISEKPAIELDRFGARVTSCYLRVFISRMQYFLQAHPLPLVDETGYQSMVDLEIQANLSNVNEINKALEEYDLKFVEKYANLEMLVITDRNQTNPHTTNPKP